MFHNKRGNDMENIIQELGEGRRTRRPKRKLTKMIPPKLRPKVMRTGQKTAAAHKQGGVVERGIGAYLNAMAHVAGIENSRPNRAFSLIGTDPTVTTAPGGVLTASFTLPSDSFIVYWIAAPGDVDNWVISTLKVAGFDVLGGSPINLAAFQSDLNRMDRPGPLTGRVFSAGTTVEISLRNISGAPAIFRGIAVWMISTDCASTTKGKPAPSVLSFTSISKGFRSLWNKGLRR
jgi:hypothetical protein